MPSEDQPAPEKGEESDEDVSGDEGSENSGAEDQTQDNDHEPADDDEDWSQYQEEAKKETVLETKAKESHPVHCPYFPIVSQAGYRNPFEFVLLIKIVLSAQRCGNPCFVATIILTRRVESWAMC